MDDEAEEDFPEPELWCEEFCGEAEYHHKDCPVAKQLRGTWCTPKWLADALGWFAVDPCTNARSHVQASIKCVLEEGATGLHDLAVPGSLKTKHGSLVKADKGDRVFVNPPYGPGIVEKWVNHYAHTRFVFLLRWDPSTVWWTKLIAHSTHVWFPSCRLNFEPPPRIKASSNAYPHALYCKNPHEPEMRSLDKLGTWWSPVDLSAKKTQSDGNGRPEQADRGASASQGAGGAAKSPPGGGVYKGFDLSKLRKEGGGFFGIDKGVNRAFNSYSVDPPPGPNCINRNPHRYPCCAVCSIQVKYPW